MTTNLPPLFSSRDITEVDFQLADGNLSQEPRYGEPGDWYFETPSKGLRRAIFPAVVQVIDHELTGSAPTSDKWRITIIPITTPHGAAGADAMGPAYVEFQADADSLADTVLGLIEAATTGATIEDSDDLAAWSRLLSYGSLSVGASSAKIRFTANAPDYVYAVEVTRAGESSSTETVIAAPASTTMKVGFYVAIDRNKGSNGYDAMGDVFVTAITSSTPEADIVGPIMRGVGTKDTEPGFPYREYEQGSQFSLAADGCPTVYGSTVIPATSIGKPVYVRHTAGTGAQSALLPGMATDAAGAAVDATPDVWTGTPAETNSAIYSVMIEFGLASILLTYTADGSAAAAEVVAGLKTRLAMYNTSPGQPLYGITAGAATDTLVLTGPADGRTFTASTPANSAGAVTWVHTTSGANTHTLFSRDKFAAASKRIGAVPVTIAA